MAAGGTLSRLRDRAARLRGAVTVAADGTVAAADISEEITRAVHRTLGMRTGAPGRTRGITGFVYRTVRRIARLVGLGVRGAPAPSAPPTGVTATALAVLNGVMGDRLAAGGNPLATPLSFWHDGQPLDLASPIVAPTPHLVLTVHGLCLDERCWRVAEGDTVTDIGRAVADAVGGVAVGVRYNTGRHISDNGADLAVGIQALVDGWPVPVESVRVVAHSMGGLVMRSAIAQARARGLTWPDYTTGVVCLGTPHHGSPVERVGKWVHDHLDTTRFTAPLARAAELRSAGVTDLRWGIVREDDWAARDRFEHADDLRTPLALPPGIPFYAVAASLAPVLGTPADETLGDGLVPVSSALGAHPDAKRALVFTHARVFAGPGHVDLLGDAAVQRQVLDWLAPGHLPDAGA